MRINQLALAMMLLTGATGVLNARAADLTDTASASTNAAIDNTPPASAISQPDTGLQAQSGIESSTTNPAAAVSDPATAPQQSAAHVAEAPSNPAVASQQSAAPVAEASSNPAAASQQSAAPVAEASSSPAAALQQFAAPAATASSNPADAAQQSAAPVAEASSSPAAAMAPAAGQSVQPHADSVSQAADASSSPQQVGATPAEPNQQPPGHVETSQKPALTSAVTTQPTFTPEQEARIGELAKAYLLKHPELLIEVEQQLQKNQYDEQVKKITQAVLQHQDELLNDETVPSIGPASAKVVLIEFFDYQCSVCARQAPVIMSLMKNLPEVRVIFKEWPIFGYRWKPSFKAAETGLRIWQQKGGDAYMNYHNALFDTGHTEGALTQSDITKAASAAGAGKLKSKDNDMLGTLARTDALAQNLGFQGTPGIIVLPASGATAESVTVFPGGASEALLQDAINQASGQP